MPTPHDLSDLQGKGNTTLLKIVCAVLPGALMAAAHYFPWRKVRQSELGPLQRYAIGTSAIVGTAACAVSVSDGDRHDHTVMLLLAASAAGGTTIMAYMIDELIRMRGELVKLNAEREHLANHEYIDY